MKKWFLISMSAVLAFNLFANGINEEDPSVATWPDEDKVITVIVPYGAGGGTDSVFRPLVEEVKNYLPCRIEVVNIGGNGSADGTNELLTRPADGYSVLAAGAHTIVATMEGKTAGYEELDHLISLNWDPFILAVSVDQPYSSVKGLIQDAQADPGAISLGNAGGGATAVASNSINLSLNRVFNVVPFSGGGSELKTEVLAGRCVAGVFSQSEIAKNLDKYRPLAILADERSRLDVLADVPTLADEGFENLPAPGGSFRSVAVRSGTPAEVKSVLTEAFEQAYRSESYQAFMAEQGLIPTFFKDAALDDYFSDLVDVFTDAYKAAGLYR